MRDRVDQVAEIDGLGGNARPVGAQPRQGQELADQRVQPFRLLLDPVELQTGARTALPRQAECHAHSCQRRAQLVRDVLQQPFLRIDLLLQPAGHGIEVAGQSAQLVAATADRGGNPRGKVAGGQFPGRGAERRDRARHRAREPQARHTGHDDRQQQEGNARPRLFKRREHAVMGHDDEHVFGAIGADENRNRSRRQEARRQR